MTALAKDQKYGPVVGLVNSESEPDKQYEVRKLGKLYSCQCLGWRFCKEEPRSCRHVLAVILGAADCPVKPGMTVTLAPVSARRAAVEACARRVLQDGRLEAATDLIEALLATWAGVEEAPASVATPGVRRYTLSE